jgi:magnesium transporter
MAKIYSDIQSGMMDAFASVISNNLNIVMKQLTIITIILMIPTLIASFYGMNVPNRLEENRYAFWFILGGSGIVAVIASLLIRRKKWM